jgi:hypothetical protein
VGVIEVRWDKGGIIRAGDIFFSMEKEMKVINWEQDCLYTTDYFKQLKRVEFLSDRLLYIALIGRWCNIIVLSAHAATEKTSDELNYGRFSIIFLSTI